MNLVLFDDPIIRMALLPFTFTRPAAEIRIGILTISEKWHKWLGLSPSHQTVPYLQKKFSLKSTSQNLLVNGAICPDQQVVDAINALPSGYFLVQNQMLIAASSPTDAMNDKNVVEYKTPLTIIDKPWKIFQQNAAQIKEDFRMLTRGRVSAPIHDPFTRVYAPENIFIEEGVEIRAAVLNAESGPIYLGKNSVIQEGSVIRGSFALCEAAQINMGTRIRGDTTIGPHCKVGGEISNSVFFGNSNKSHDGYLGNAVIGEWCNMGANTNASNLKNNYHNIKIWNHATESFAKTELQFCGLMMGDHSKCGINTMFNTATIVDVCCNIYGAGYPSTYIPSFCWGGSQGFVTHQLNKVFETEERVMGRRNVPLTDVDKEILSHIFGLTAPQRVWDKK